MASKYYHCSVGSARTRTALILVAASALVACGDARPRSVVLVTLDTTRVDLLGAYGGRGETPALDAFAADALRFDSAFTTAPYTGPSHASMLTGQDPPRHGLRDYLEQALPDPAETLAEILSSNGYATAAFVSTYVLDPRFGLDQGFDVYDSPDRDGGDRHWREGPLTTGRALDWLTAQPADRPLFLWVHWYDAHGPYQPPPEVRKPLPSGVRPGSPDARRQRYYEQARVLDAEFARLRDALAASGRDPIVVVVSDHGELLGHHGRKLGAHSNELVDATVRIPMLIRIPGVAPARRGDAASVIDLVPTLVSALGLAVPSQVEGRDLLSEAPAGPVAAYSETFYPFLLRSPEGEEWASLRDERFVLMARPNRVELYDLEADPAERVDVSTRFPERFEALQEALARRRARWGNTLSQPLDLDPEEEADHRARLEALGYIE